MAKGFLKFFVILLVCGLSARLFALEMSVAERTEPDVDTVVAKVKYTVAHMYDDGVIGPSFSSQVSLPAEFLTYRTALLPRMHYAAALLYYQNELLTLVLRIDAAHTKKRELKSCIVARALIGDEQRMYDEVTREAAGRRDDAACNFLSDHVARFDTMHKSILLRNMILLKLQETEIKWIDAQIAHIENLVCDRYDAKQWKMLRGCIYPLVHFLEGHAHDESDFVLRQSEWYHHATQLWQHLGSLIDRTVGRAPHLQRYRANLWDPAITIAPKTVLCVDIDALVREIGQVGSSEQSPRAAASSPSPKKKYKKRSKCESKPTIFIPTDPETKEPESEEPTDGWGDDEDFDLDSAFCRSAAGSPPHSDGTPNCSGRLSRLSVNTVSDVSPASSPEGDSAHVRVFTRYDYDERVFIWHGANDVALHEHVKASCPGALYFKAVAQHRIPFIIENQFADLGHHEARVRGSKIYRTLLFDGALIFDSGRCCLGTYEISRPRYRPDFVVHRFFKIDFTCPWPDSLVLPERGERERHMMDNGHAYTVYENDQAVCITEDDSWLKITYVLLK